VPDAGVGAGHVGAASAPGALDDKFRPERPRSVGEIARLVPDRRPAWKGAIRLFLSLVSRAVPRRVRQADVSRIICSVVVIPFITLSQASMRNVSMPSSIAASRISAAPTFCMTSLRRCGVIIITS